MNGPDTWTRKQLERAAREAFPVVKTLKALIGRVNANRDAMARFHKGLGWYAWEHAALQSLWGSDGVADAGVPFRSFRKAAAVLSPANNWDGLKARLVAFTRAALKGGTPGFPTYRRNRERAACILRQNDSGRPLGPKVGPFFAALSGDTSAVVIDRHTCRDAIGKDVPTAAERRAIVLAFWIVAASVGETPAGLQAGLWSARVGLTGLRPGEKANGH